MRRQRRRVLFIVVGDLSQYGLWDGHHILVRFLHCLQGLILAGAKWRYFFTAKPEVVLDFLGDGLKTID
jgi:hypothetical protein